MTTNIHDYYYNIVSKQHTSELYAQAEQARLVKTSRALARQHRREARAARRAEITDHPGTAGSWAERWSDLRSRFGSQDSAVEPNDESPTTPQSQQERERVH